MPPFDFDKLNPAEFEWDPKKNQETIQDRGMSFSRAAKIFSGPVVRWIDHRTDYGETRWVTVGRAEGRLMTVVCRCSPIMSELNPKMNHPYIWVLTISLTHTGILRNLRFYSSIGYFNPHCARI